MKVLAIDPGDKKSAAILFDAGAKTIVWKTGIHPDGCRNKWDNEKLLKIIQDFLIKDADIDLIAVESIECYGMPVGRTVFETAYTIGRIVQIANNFQKPVQMISRKDVKMNLCGNVRAKDSNIRQALIDRFGPPGTKKQPGFTYGLAADLWSALAIAVTCMTNFEEK